MDEGRTGLAKFDCRYGQIPRWGRETIFLFAVHEEEKEEEGPSLDSLLDTMTTEVGIMIVILIVVQLGADSAIRNASRGKGGEFPKIEEDAMKHYLKQKPPCSSKSKTYK